MSATSSAITGELPLAVACAETFAVYPRAAAACSTRSLNDSATLRSEPFSTREAVASETPASLATSSSVGAGPRPERETLAGEGLSCRGSGASMPRAYWHRSHALRSRPMLATDCRATPSDRASRGSPDAADPRQRRGAKAHRLRATPSLHGPHPWSPQHGA